jgi:hypothetical protein
VKKVRQQATPLLHVCRFFATDGVPVAKMRVNVCEQAAQKMEEGLDKQCWRLSDMQVTSRHVMSRQVTAQILLHGMT